MTVAVEQTEAFDSAEYVVPFPEVDGKQVDELVLRISGSLKLNRNDPEHVALVEGLRLGGYAHLRVFAAVVGKSQSFRPGDDGAETVTHAVGLRIETVTQED